MDLLNSYDTVDNSKYAVEDQLLLKLAKYRHNQDYTMMDNHYGQNRTTISKVFNHMTKHNCIAFSKTLTSGVYPLQKMMRSEPSMTVRKYQ